MAKLVKKSTADELDCLPHALRIADVAQEYRGRNIKAFDMRGLTLLADCFLMCSATSEPQLKAIYNGIKDAMKEVGVRPFHSEGELKGNWLLLDFGSVLVHIFREEAYAFYDLEGLWGDAPELDLELDEQQ